MGPISNHSTPNQLPPYSQYDIEVYALQRPFRVEIQRTIQLPSPFDIAVEQSDKLLRGKKNKSENKKEKKEQK